jgi:hypothetical protein
VRDYEQIKSLVEQCGVHAALGPVGDGWGIEQNPHELATFLAALPDDTQTVLEIGTGYRAGMARFMSECLGWDVTTVDIKDYEHAAAYPSITFIVIEWAGVEFPVFGEGFDLVIIDGDHSYDAARFDYEYYGEFAPIVMLHDIAGLRDCGGAALLWHELAYDEGRLRDGFHEVIADGDQRAGIGWMVRA